MPLGPIVPGNYVSATADNNVAPYTTLTIAPSATRPVIGADLQAFELALMNSQHGTVAFLDLPGLAGYPDGARVFVSEIGWYSYIAGSVTTADAKWVVTATGMGSGRWIHQSLAAVHLNMLPAVGPTPGDIFTIGTTVGRVNPEIVPWGTWAMQYDDAPHQYSTSSGSNVTLHDMADFGVVPAGVNLEVMANTQLYSGSSHATVVQVWMEVSTDNGSTYTNVTGNGGALSYTLNTSLSAPIAIPLSFVKHVGANTGVKFRLRAISDGTHVVTCTVDSWVGKIVRP